MYGKLMEKIEEYGVRLVDFSKITEEENKFLEAYFDMEISGLISPTIVGKRQPFPFLRNLCGGCPDHQERKRTPGDYTVWKRCI